MLRALVVMGGSSVEGLIYIDNRVYTDFLYRLKNTKTNRLSNILRIAKEFDENIIYIPYPEKINICYGD